MAEYMNMDTLKFFLHDVHDLSEVLKLDRYADYDAESVDMLLNSQKDYTDKVYYPTYREMDEQPCKFVDGRVTSHPAIAEVMKFGGENGYIGSTFDYEHGGSQMPHVVHSACSFIQGAANNNIGGYLGLTTGAAGLITTFGSQELIDEFVPNMVAGKWGGTMCLTEPQAGSSLSDITSSATPQDDGSYKIKGQKIFISGGDHQGAENFVHLYLARIDGAPKGTKGISLFVVPRLRKEADGSMVYNDVATAGDFQKMGQRGYSTTHLALGENDDCKGWLVGEENKGLKYMFKMMNGARIDVGMTAAAVASAAYFHSLQYAKERPQGRKLTSSGAKNANEEQTLIINHPDVRRMLLLQKAVVEGSLSLLTFASAQYDISQFSNDAQVRENALDLLELLTPIAKTYPSEMGRVSISNGLQIYGGYGFCTEFPLQQYYRDIRIMALYEGTTGIQSLDLLGRKCTMKGGRALQLLGAEVKKDIEASMTYDDLKPYAKVLGEKMKEVQEIMMHLGPFAMQGEFERFLADATIFMEYLSTVVVAWQWLKIATNAKLALVTGDKKYDETFYESKVHTMKFYFKYEMPKTIGLKETLLSPEVLTIMKEKELIC